MASQHSKGRFSRAALGTYEHGIRSVAATALLELADLYHVDAAALLPEHHRSPRWPHQPRFSLNVSAINALPATDQPLRAFTAQIRSLRDDYTNTELTIRHTDLQLLALSYGTAPATLRTRLIKLGVLSVR